MEYDNCFLGLYIPTIAQRGSRRQLSKLQAISIVGLGPALGPPEA